MFCSFVIIVVLCIFIFVCTSVGLLLPGECPIAVSNNNNNNNNNNIHCLSFWFFKTYVISGLRDKCGAGPLHCQIFKSRVCRHFEGYYLPFTRSTQEKHIYQDCELNSKLQYPSGSAVPVICVVHTLQIQVLVYSSYSTHIISDNQKIFSLGSL